MPPVVELDGAKAKGAESIWRFPNSVPMKGAEPVNTNKESGEALETEATRLDNDPSELQSVICSPTDEALRDAPCSDNACFLSHASPSGSEGNCA